MKIDSMFLVLVVTYVTVPWVKDIRFDDLVRSDLGDARIYPSVLS